MTTDHIHSPAHYMAGDYECHQIQDALASTLWKGDPKVVRLGNALKYLWRACSKGKRDEDLRKAATEILLALDEDWRMRVRPGMSVGYPAECAEGWPDYEFKELTYGAEVMLEALGKTNCMTVRCGPENKTSALMTEEEAFNIGSALVAWAKGESI